MGELETLFEQCNDGRCHKWRHYFDIYGAYIAKFKATACVYLEIGVEKGGSLDIMRKYLGHDGADHRRRRLTDLQRAGESRVRNPRRRPGGLPFLEGTGHARRCC